VYRCTPAIPAIWEAEDYEFEARQGKVCETLFQKQNMKTKGLRM
jgi:hypothetical protein